MLRSISLALTLGLACLPAIAQNATKTDASGPSRGDVAVDYSYLHLPDGALKNLNGVSFSGAYDFTKWIGAAADVDIVHASANGITENLETYTFGPRIYHRMGRYMPFGEFLVGAATSSFNPMGVTSSGTDFAFNLLAAVDVGINKSGRFAVRPEAAWVYLNGNGNSNSGVHIGAGLAYHF